MNPFLTDIYSQPSELKKVLRSLLAEYSQQVRQVADMLTRAEEIVLTSMGSAYYSLMPMYYALLSRGKRVSLIETSELLHMPQQLDANKLYVLMSRSGESYEVSKLPAVLEKKGISSIGITMTPESTMARGVSVMLYDCSSYDALICTKAYTTMALCGLMCVSAMEEGYPDPQQFANLEEMFTWMEENKQEILKQFEEISFLGKAPNFYFLSHGYGMGVINSGSLWMEETSRKCGNVSSLENFYHGPMEISNTRTVPVFLDIYADERSDMIWEKICGYSEHLIYIGPANKGKKDCTASACVSFKYPVFDVDDGYKMILLALYFQLFAYQCALGAGIEPGNLETVSWVVK